ncbi:unnamed protein product [Plutella xylostella]|nr:unnamed protein product [Plutella xylostella]
MEFENDFSLKEWAKDKPLSILQLDPADRAVLRIAGERTGVTSHCAAALLRETQGLPTPSQPARLYMATCTAALPGAAIMRRLGPPSSPPTAPNLLLVAFYDGQEIP